MNIMEVKFSAKSENESLARVIVASFAAKLDPTIDELSDIKTAVSEAVTNAIIHGYEEDETKLKEYVESKGMIFISTPFSRAAAMANMRISVESTVMPRSSHSSRVRSMGKPKVSYRRKASSPENTFLPSAASFSRMELT